MIRSFPPHPNPLPPRERGGHSSPQQSWGVFWHILINEIEEIHIAVVQVMEQGGELPTIFMMGCTGKVQRF
jgi:hypothetical protein